MDAKHSLLSQDDSEEEVLHEVTTDNLKFQDLPLGGSGKIKTPDKSGSFKSFPATGDDDGDVNTELLEGEKKQPPFWTFDYYQTWFDVDTNQSPVLVLVVVMMGLLLYAAHTTVGKRILGSMIPKPGRNYLRLHIRPNPDLYGPFWICTTLVFTTAICGNLANYISCGRYDYQWTYDFHKVTLAAAAIFSYWWLIPTGLYGLIVWRALQCGYSYMELICVYGYSLAIYIPISILWVIPFYWLQLSLLLVGTLLSGCVLLFTFWPALREDADRRIAAVIMAAILLCHAALAAGFVLYFFHVPESSCPHELTPATNLPHSLTTPSAPPHITTTHAPVKAAGAGAGAAGPSSAEGGGVPNPLEGPSGAFTNNKKIAKLTEKTVEKRTIRTDQQSKT